jgi:hypothetical protein
MMHGLRASVFQGLPLAAWGLDKHLFQTGGFELLEFLKLDGVFGNQRVELAEVGADFLLFGGAWDVCSNGMDIVSVQGRNC